jgi:hypothetical protein
MLDCGKVPVMGWEAAHCDRDLVSETFRRCHHLSALPFEDEGKLRHGPAGVHATHDSCRQQLRR